MLTRREFLHQTSGALLTGAALPTAQEQKSRTQVFYDRAILLHQPPAGHPESPQRIDAVVNIVRLLERQGRLSVVTPRPAAEEELLLVHSPEYIRKVQAEIA